jgi:hypothetical protein
MGIWRDVGITATGPIVLRYPAVLTKLNLPSTDRAMLTIRAELTNASYHPVESLVKGQIEDLAFQQAVRLGPKETQVVHFTPEKFPQLRFNCPIYKVKTGAIMRLERQEIVKTPETLKVSSVVL